MQENRQQVRIELTLNEELTNNDAATVTINATDERTGKGLITRLLGPEVKFVARDGGFDVMHPKHLAGKQPIGWGNSISVPARFGVQSVTEHRLSQEKQAA